MPAGADPASGPEPALVAARERMAFEAAQPVDDPTSPTKACASCGEVLPRTAEFFPRNKTRRDGYATRCKSCNRTAVKEWVANNRQRANRTQQKLYWKRRAEGLRRVTVFKNGVKTVKWAKPTKGPAGLGGPLAPAAPAATPGTQAA